MRTRNEFTLTYYLGVSRSSSPYLVRPALRPMSVHAIVGGPALEPNSVPVPVSQEVRSKAGRVEVGLRESPALRNSAMDAHRGKRRSM